MCRCVSSSGSEDEEEEKESIRVAAQLAKPPQQRLEACLKAPLVLKKRRGTASKVPVASACRQSSLAAAFGKPSACGLTSKRKVVDLFACIGGFSCGAAQAGHAIVLAVDCDKAALHIHEANHPEALHKEMFLGPETEDELVEAIRSVVSEGEEYHLHGSPPCTRLSGARQMAQLTREELDRGEAEGMCLVDWFLDFVERIKPTTWSMEQVNAKPVREALTRRMKRNRDLFDFESVEFSQFGVPQTRNRLLAGSPALIARIRCGVGMRVARVRTIRDAIEEIPERAVFVRGNWHRRTNQDEVEEAANGEFLHERAQKLARTLDQPAWTILSNKELQWWDRRYACIRNLNINETMALQTFPPTYVAGPQSTISDFLVGVGNAVPPLFARKLMSVATEAEGESDV